MKPHQWLGVAHVPGPRLDLRPVTYIALTSVAMLVAFLAVQSAPPALATAKAAADEETMTDDQVAAARGGDGGGAPADAAAAAAAPAVSMQLALADEAPARARGHGGRGPDDDDGDGDDGDGGGGPGVLGARGLAEGISRVAGDSDLRAGGDAIIAAAREDGFEVIEDPCGSRCFGGSLRAAKRPCPLGERLDDDGRCVPDEG